MWFRRFAVCLTLALQACAIHSPSAYVPGSASDRTVSELPGIRYAMWSRSLAHVPLPGAGCYTASFPATRWILVPCSKERHEPNVRSAAAHFKQNGDYAAQTTHPINQVTGWFPAANVSIVTSVRAGSDTGSGSYGLQLNTQYFSTAACGHIPNCEAWEQFVYQNPPGKRRAYLAIWDFLINKNYPNPLTTCPPNAGWTLSGGECFQSNPPSNDVPNQPVANLEKMTLIGKADQAGDSIELAVGNKAYAFKNVQRGTVTELWRYWNLAEFNVFAPGSGSAGYGIARFGANTTITVGLEIQDGVYTAPACVRNDGQTAETNNLRFVGNPNGLMGLPIPSMYFTETNAVNVPKPKASCATFAGNGG